MKGDDYVTDDAAKMKREYHRQYQKKNKEKLNDYVRKWRSENPDKVRQYNQSYWERKAQLCLG